MIGMSEYCGSCKYYERPPKLIMGYCRKHDEETAIFGRCKDYEDNIIHENEVFKRKREDIYSEGGGTDGKL